MSRRSYRIAGRAMVLLLISAVLASIAAPIAAMASTQQSSQIPINTQRYGSADRYSTSLDIAEEVIADAGGTLGWAVLVSGQSWPDAVVASSIAGALGAPVLLTPPGELRIDTERFLERADITDIIVIGSPARPGVSDAVTGQLTEAGYSVERITGRDRYDTGVEVARRLGEILRSHSRDGAAAGSMPGFGVTAIVASGAVFADALVSGPVSAYGGHPVLLTPPQRLDAGVAAYLREASVEHVVLMGGTAALGQSVERALADLDIEATRLAGATRFETAVRMSEFVRGRYSRDPECFSYAHLGIARDRVPFDSISAGPLLARHCASLLLTDPRRTNIATQDHLGAARSSAAASGTDALGIHVFGGTAAVSAGVLSAYFDISDTKAEPVALNATCGGNGSTLIPLEIAVPMYRATWSPDCSRVAYLRLYNELWVANGDGSDARRLLGANTRAHSPAWSPDGTRIAFAAADYSGGVAAKHIYVVNADGSGTRQLTSGEVNDDSPSWSPDGKQMVFQRRDGIGSDYTNEALAQDQHLIILNLGNGDEEALFEGGEAEFSPAWSPDGKRIAFTGWATLWLADSDGTGKRVLTDDGSTWRGVTWSPDSKRLATVRFRNADEGGVAVVVVDADGIGEELIPVPGLAPDNNYLPDRAPQWSPDGRRLFSQLSNEDPFNTSPRPGMNWMQVMAAPEIGVPARRTCKLPSRADSYTTGFPLPSWAPSAIGTLRVAVLFVDFPDANVHYSTELEASSSLAYVERYFDHSSSGRLDIEFVPHHVWLRAEHNVDHYENERFYNGLLDARIGEHAVQLADDDFDFSDIDIVLVVMPSTLFSGGGNEGSSVSADGNSMRHVRMNHRHYGFGSNADGSLRTPSINPWGRTAVHEMMHSLGLRDLYWEHTLGFRLWPLGDPLAPPSLPEGESWALMEFGMMQLNGYDQVTGGNLKDRRLEMLAWSRWQLGWLDDAQVECLTSDFSTIALRAAAEAGTGTAMAAVQVSANSAIVIESRRLIGYDSPSTHTRQRVAAGEQDPQYLAEGVLVYTVNSLRGEHPVSLVQDNGRAYLKDFPLLAEGDSVSVAGYTISVVDDTGYEHVVSVRKND